MELEAAGSTHGRRAGRRRVDAELLNKLADEERKHERTAGELEEKHLTTSAKAKEDESHRKLVFVAGGATGLAGLMDGSVSTLAPIFCRGIRFT